jgi:hypothetical protein
MATVVRCGGKTLLPLVKMRIGNSTLDDAGAVRLSTALADAVLLYPKVFLVDLASCSHVSIEGVRVLLQARQVIGLSGGRMTLLFSPLCLVAATGQERRIRAARGPHRPKPSAPPFARRARPAGRRP